MTPNYERIRTMDKELNRKLGPAFITFSMPFDEETAVMRFKARYGYPPDTIEEFKNFLMVGPAPERELGVSDEN